jgi:hypothetical protein
MTTPDSGKKKQQKIDIELIFKVIENRGYQRLPHVPTMNSLIYEKVKHLYVDSPKRRKNS